jgi:hypothetical protein
MKDKKRIATIIRWIARIWGSVSLAFLVFMVGAEIIGTFTGGDNPNGGFKSTSEMVSFLFFPVCTIIGLGLAWKWEGLGGLITIGGIIGFHIIRPDLILDLWIDGLAAPGLLFLIYWILSKGLTNSGVTK